MLERLIPVNRPQSVETCDTSTLQEVCGSGRFTGRQKEREACAIPRKNFPKETVNSSVFVQTFPLGLAC